MSESGLPIETFKFYGQKSEIIEAGETESNSKENVKNDGNGSEKSRKKRTENLQKIFDDSEVLELPATQSPEKKPKHRLTSKSLFMNYPKKPTFENKTLKGLRGSERLSFLSSPSMLPTKPSHSSDKLNKLLNNQAPPSPKKPKVSFSNDDIFNDLKKQNNSPAAPEIVEQTVTATKSPDDEKNSTMSVKPASPSIEIFQANPEWSKLSADSLRHLKRSASNFRLILDELNRVNEKIMTFRRGIAKNQLI